jgi:putative restriction endonuclease
MATRDVQMVDACHIVPFAESHDDTIGNGLSLSPTFHRAFDRHLISIDSDYRVVVSAAFAEAGSQSIRAFAGRVIALPEGREYWPAMDNLRWHYDRFVKMGM